MDKMYEEARKLGLDDEELVEYGICDDGNGKGSCKEGAVDYIKTIDHIYDKADKKSAEISDKIIKYMKKA